VDIPGPFQVLKRQLALKPKGRKPPALGPKVRIEAVHVSPVTSEAGVGALVNGAGLSDWDRDGLREHGTAMSSMWEATWTTNLALEFDLPGSVPLSGVEVWNFNAEWQTTNGVRKADVAVSADGKTWQTVSRRAEFGEADGTADYDEPTVLKLGGVTARKVRFDNIVPWGSSGKVGLSEVVFHETEGVRAGPLQPEDGATGVGFKKPVLVWSAVTNATTYRVYLGTDSAALKALVTTNATAAEVPDLKPDTAYFWRVDSFPSSGRGVRGRVARFNTAGLAGWWKLDETEGAQAADAAGGHLGEVHGRPRWAPAQGRLGGALEFDGAENYVDCGDSPDFDFRDGLTISVWIKVRKFDKPWQVIVTKGDHAWRLVRFQNEGRVIFYPQGAKTVAPARPHVVSKRTVDDGQWHHVVATYDGQRAALYLDGQLEDAVTATGPLTQNAEPVLLGENPERRGRCFNGWMDDVRLYGYGLSEQEVQALYRSSAK
jgi:hypothetical protein